MKPDMDLERAAHLASAFLETEYGQLLLARITDLHYNLHLEAEQAKSMEAQAMSVQKAAGVREVLNMIQKDAELLELGELKEKEMPDATEV